MKDKIKEALKGTDLRVATDEEMEKMKKHAKETVERMSIEHVLNTPAFAKKEYEDLCKQYEKAESNEEKDKLAEKFGEFGIEDSEIISLKEEIEPKKWRKYVNINKQGPYSYACVEAVVKMSKLLDADIPPKPAWNQTAKELDLTGFMMGMLIGGIKKFHPKGEEVNKAWNLEHGVKDSKGTVNPALFTMKEKK